VYFVYFFAIADMDPQNLKYNLCVLDYAVGFWGKLANTPTHVSGSLTITNHEFKAGRSLAIFAGAGSLATGWHFKVYFDGSLND
jgi:hypothetical protein